jgi:RNA polymerase sigma factor (TIGR02999 family)
VTELLARVVSGHENARDELMEVVYPQLKRIAANLFRNERPGHTLQPTALVNEAYLRVFGPDTIDWRSRAHFFAVLATQIRRVLVDHGRAVRADKRGAGAAKLPLDERTEGFRTGVDEDYLALDEALAALANQAPRAARVVELKFFGGLTDAEVAEVMGISMPTVTRDWRYARAALLAQLTSIDP